MALYVWAELRKMDCVFLAIVASWRPRTWVNYIMYTIYMRSRRREAPIKPKIPLIFQHRRLRRITHSAVASVDNLRLYIYIYGHSRYHCIMLCVWEYITLYDVICARYTVLYIFTPMWPNVRFLYIEQTIFARAYITGRALRTITVQCYYTIIIIIIICTVKIYCNKSTDYYDTSKRA